METISRKKNHDKELEKKRVAKICARLIKQNHRVDFKILEISDDRTENN